ncbi:MAG: glycosyltransferase family 4 protein [Halioglobus sp.]
MKTSLALVTPWPPQHTGIADYAYDLAGALYTSGVDVTVFTRETEPRALSGIRIVSVQNEEPLKALQDFDCIVYQLGNNTTFHLWMIPLLQRYPGTVHIHDMVMHHIAAWQTWMQDDAEAYIALLEKWYGLKGLSHALESLDSGNYLWESDRVTDFPLYEEYAQYAKTIIVHSGFVLQRVRKALPDTPSFQVPQLYNIEPRAQCATALRKICVMGGVDPQKHLDWILEALATIQDRSNFVHPIELHIVGAVDQRCMHLEETARALASDKLSIVFHGRATQSQFQDIFLQSDLCIALRFPTMGETSAIVMRALQKGIPTIVNNIGWYAELPDNIVKKLPIHNCADQLRQLLEYYIAQPQVFSDWSSDCLHFAKTGLSLTLYGEHYRSICENPQAMELVTNIQAAALADCGLSGVGDEDVLLQQILEQSQI